MFTVRNLIGLSHEKYQSDWMYGLYFHRSACLFSSVYLYVYPDVCLCINFYVNNYQSGGEEQGDT